jgi:sugar lactone lactonase YvrE
LAGAARNRHVDGDATQATFYNIEAIARDEAGNLYLADSNNHAIRKLSTNGIVSTLVGDADSGALTVFPIGNPRALAFDPNGNLLIGGNAIWRLTPLGDVTVVLDGLTVNCLAVARDGTIYVGEGGFSARIRKIAPNGTVSVLAGDAPIEGRRDGVGTDARFNWIAGLAIGPDGMLYASDSNRSNSIRRISPDGVVTTFFDFGSSFMGPEALAFDSEGNLFVGCWGESTIFRLDPGGRIQPYAGSRGGVETIDAGVPMARFGSSYGNILYSSGPGWLLYSWQDGYADGLTLARIASTPGATVSEDAAVLGSPSGLVFDSSDTLYVADGSAVRRITTDGVVRTIAGIPGSGGHRDGQGANARFFGPQGIAVDRGGNVFVAEEKSSTLRKITPAGVVSTVAGTPGRPGHKDAVFSARAMRVNIAGSPVTAEDSRDTAGDSRTRLST